MRSSRRFVRRTISRPSTVCHCPATWRATVRSLFVTSRIVSRTFEQTSWPMPPARAPGSCGRKAWTMREVLDLEDLWHGTDGRGARALRAPWTASSFSPHAGIRALRRASIANSMSPNYSSSCANTRSGNGAGRGGGRVRLRGGPAADLRGRPRTPCFQEEASRSPVDLARSRQNCCQTGRYRHSPRHADALIAASSRNPAEVIILRMESGNPVSGEAAAGERT